MSLQISGSGLAQTLQNLRSKIQSNTSIPKMEKELIEQLIQHILDIIEDGIQLSELSQLGTTLTKLVDALDSEDMKDMLKNIIKKLRLIEEALPHDMLDQGASMAKPTSAPTQTMDRQHQAIATPTSMSSPTVNDPSPMALKNRGASLHRSPEAPSPKAGAIGIPSIENVSDDMHALAEEIVTFLLEHTMDTMFEHSIFDTFQGSDSGLN